MPRIHLSRLAVGLFVLGTVLTPDSSKKTAIALPRQTIGLEKDASKPTTRRNLTLDDLLVHLKHYNPTTRKGICSIAEI